MEHQDLPSCLASWACTELGDYRIVANHRFNNSRTGVWRLACSDEEFILKLHRRRLRWYTEVTAYQNWAQAYSPYVPRLRAIYSDDKFQGVLITALPGRPLRECCHLDTEAITNAYQRAGELCRRLADLTVGERFGMTETDGTPVDYEGQASGQALFDPVEYTRHSFMIAYNEARNLNALSRADDRLTKSALDSMDVFAGEPPLLVNGDYTPGNWMVDPSGVFSGVIDFEHISWDVEAAALTRLQSTYFPACPSGEAAFMEGYGRDLRDKAEQCRILRIRHALYNLVFGIKLKNERWIEQGRRDLRRLRENT